MSFIEDLADALARDVLAASDEIGDDRFFEKVSKAIGASSPTLQEAFLTCIRIRLAEARGRSLLNETLAAIRPEAPTIVAVPASKPAPTPPAGRQAVPVAEPDPVPVKGNARTSKSMKAAQWPEDW